MVVVWGVCLPLQTSQIVPKEPRGIIMISLILATLIALASLVYGLMAMLANGNSSAPTVDGVPYWPSWVGLLCAVGLVVAHHYGMT